MRFASWFSVFARYLSVTVFGVLGCGGQQDCDKVDGSYAVSFTELSGDCGDVDSETWVFDDGRFRSEDTSGLLGAFGPWPVAGGQASVDACEIDVDNPHRDCALNTVASCDGYTGDGTHLRFVVITHYETNIEGTQISGTLDLQFEDDYESCHSNYRVKAKAQ
jgi:hypothetical protein